MSGPSITWDSQSANSSQNMPIGGCDVGVAVWMEGGDVLAYIDRSGSFDENNQMLKLGRIRVRATPNVFAGAACTFKQELDTQTGTITITGSDNRGQRVTYTLWCRTDAPALYVQVSASQPIQVEAWYESWRFEDREVPPQHRMPLYSMQGYPGEVVTRADTVEAGERGVLFYHRNVNGDNCFEKVARQQGLGERMEDMYNPQKDCVFGGCMCGEGFLAPAGTTKGSYAGTQYIGHGLASAAGTQHNLVVALSSGHYPDAQMYAQNARDWAARALEQRDEGRGIALGYWSDFWLRSSIDVHPGETKPDDATWQVGRNYNLFRYMLGFNARGDHPTKFNGGLLTTDAVFSVDEQYGGQTPDYRNWGGGSFTAQNQRLVYWPMLASGDWGLMAAQFDFYNKALPNAVARAKQYWDHEGAAFTEQMENFGLPVGCEWGWENANHSPKIFARRPAHDPTEIVGPWVRYLYTTQLEFCLMILKYARYSGEDIAPYKELIHQCIIFFDRHYRLRHFLSTARELDGQGKLVFFPSTAAETYKDATNPTDLVAAMEAVLSEVLAHHRALFADCIDEYQSIKGTLPPIAFRWVEGKRVIAPAKSWSDIMNVELPQLYPVFPYGLYGLGKPDLQTAVDTYFAPAEAEGQRDYISWHQDNIFAARLGLVDEAARLTFAKLKDGPRRFPAYWGPGHDWVPDHNWGGSGMLGLQEMLLQSVDDKLLLFPAWPKGTPVHFKLHAPCGTTVEAEMKDGAARLISITPQSRQADVVIVNG